jgi:hypothetical protein
MKYATYPFECTAEYEVNMDEAPYKDSFNVNQAYGPASSYEYAAGFNTDTCQLSPERGYVVGMRMLRTSPDCLGPNEVPSEYLACDVSISGAKLTGQSFSGGGVDGSPMTLSSSFSAYNAFRARSFVFPGSP